MSSSAEYRAATGHIRRATVRWLRPQAWVLHRRSNRVGVIVSYRGDLAEVQFGVNQQPELWRLKELEGVDIGEKK